VPEADARSLSQDAQEALRRRAVKLVVEDDWSYVEAAAAVGVTDRAVGLWVRRFRREGPGSLAKRRRGRRVGAQQALTAAQQHQIAELIVGKCPDQLRIPGLLWTRAAVQKLIELRTGVSLEITSVGRYLKAWGFTLKKPSRRALEQDPVVVKAWLEDIYPALERKAKREGALILWGDESGIRMHDLVPQAGYAPKGQRAVARIAGRRAGANMISAIANGGQMSFRVFHGRFTADVFIDFLARLIKTHQGRKIYLVVDNHSTHHAKKVRQWLARDGRADKLELVFLPAYSPELNPDENLNQDLKRHLRQTPDRPTDRVTLMTAIRGFLRSVQRQPARVASYFNGEHVTYAAARYTNY
jgi:transposase